MRYSDATAPEPPEDVVHPNGGSGQASVARTLTVEEAAAYLSIGRAAAYEAVRRGEIPAIRIGRLWRVPRARLLAMLGEEDE